MLTFFIDQKHVDSTPEFSLQNLKDYSRDKNWRIIIRGFAVLEKGVVRWMA